MEKCIPLCANCHAILHYNQKIETGYQPKYNKRKVERPSKEVLEKLVWEKPSIQIAKELGVSDKAISLWCENYKIDKPPRGYWSKIKSRNE